MPHLVLLAMCGLWLLVWGESRCGGYSKQATRDGGCHLQAARPQRESQPCPDVFRCADQVKYWLHQNEARKQESLTLSETLAEVQEELRSHRHRVKVLELRSEQRNGANTWLEQRLAELERRRAEAASLLRLQASLVYHLHNQIRNLSLLAERLRRNPGCVVNIVRTGPPPSPSRALRPEVQPVRSCPIDCASIYHSGVRRSGVYTVVPSLGAMPVDVFCDMERDGGGWTVIQRRHDGSTSFQRGWKEYKHGFGQLRGEFWLGNEHIHKLSRQGAYALRIDLEDWNGKHKHALYQSFSIEDEARHYRLHVGHFSGTVKDSFAWYHNQHIFSTPDTGNVCARISHGGWWYHQCFFSNLNGVYYRGGGYYPKGKNPLGPDGIVWHAWKDSDYYSLKSVSMMIRPRTFRPHLSP